MTVADANTRVVDDDATKFGSGWRFETSFSAVFQ